MINNLLSFGAKSVNPELLEKTLTTRKKVVDEIEASCVNKVLKSATYQSLIIAPRGSGKTHVIKVLYHRLKDNKNISSKSVIAYMSEDEVGIADFTDLMINIFRAFIRYEEPNSEILNTKIEEAADISNRTERISHIKRTLNIFAEGRIIILLIENFDNILNALGKKGQAELRDFMHEYNNLSIIATSQNLIKSLQDSQYPFYNFFSVHQLKKLTYEEASAFFRQIATAENHTGLLEEMEKPEFEGKIRAIYELTEGNHRLLVTFYSFLKAEFKSEFSNVFVKVMNDLKPYYELFVNALGPQQQKIVKFLSQHRRAISGKEIARACFLESKTLSKQTSILFQNGMIDKTKSGKDVYYELKEPLMRISFEIGDNPQGIATLFVEFLSSFYAAQEISSKYLEYKYGTKFQVQETQQKYISEANMYYSALPKKVQGSISQIEDNLNNVKSIDELILRIREYSDDLILMSIPNLDISTLGKRIKNSKNIRKKINITLTEFSRLITNTIALSLEQLNSMVYAIENDLGNDNILEGFISHLKLTETNLNKGFGNELYNEFLLQVHNGASNVIENIDSLNILINKPQFENDFALNFLLAQAYSKHHKWTEALDHYLYCYQLQPKDEDLLSAIIKVYRELGDFHACLKYIYIALEHHPENSIFLEHLENSLIQLEMLDELKPIIQKNITANEQREIQNYLESYVFIAVIFPDKSSFFSSLFSFLIEELENQSETQKLWQALTKIIFSYLINLEIFSVENRNIFRNTLVHSISEYKESIIPLKMLTVGMEYLVQENKNALFDLSKEERKVFQENVLDVIEKNKKSDS